MPDASNYTRKKPLWSLVSFCCEFLRTFLFKRRCSFTAESLQQYIPDGVNWKAPLFHSCVQQTSPVAAWVVLLTLHRTSRSVLTTYTFPCLKNLKWCLKNKCYCYSSLKHTVSNLQRSIAVNSVLAHGFFGMPLILEVRMPK